MKVSKKILAIMLALVCAISVIAVGTPTEVYAAKVTEITLIEGEKTSFSPDYYNVKSVASDKKSVVFAKKNEDESTEIILKAKEKGTANVTVKTERGTKKYKVTVVENDISFKAVAQVGSYVIFKVTNKTKVTIPTLYFDYKIKDADGDVIKADTDSVYKIAAKSTAYTSVYVGYGEKASLKKSSAKINLEESRRYLNYKYTDQTKKVKVTVTKEEEGDRTVDFKLKFKSSVNDYTTVAADLVLYDSDNNIIDIIQFSKYLGKKETTSQEGKSYAVDYYDHYKLFVRAYTEEY